MSKPGLLPSLPGSSTDNPTSLLPSLNQSTIPPPSEDLPDETTNNNGSMEDGDDDDDSNDGEDSIKTEENVAEVPCPELDELTSGNPFSITSTAAPKKTGESRSLKVLKQIIEPCEDQEGNSTFELELEKIQNKTRDNLTLCPQLKKVYMDSYEICFDSKNVASVMESVDENLHISKSTQHVMGAICKVFLAELVSETQKVRDDDKNGMGPLLPQEVAAAYRRLIERGSVPDINKAPFFCDN
ncbi:hypothetical protein ENUP19_0224G0039 [Entamoeba nuttalli]|uniref:TAFII28-like protein domain-containing protein n=2 Tax=Entamoeba nuttalli TaxID=412467 RepID=K2HY80_ENTNP|nr:hypothetical protein ENU1_060010 [Entamoeba nuttalli P19]EKE41320.1 hypothetical protein ENU1_060010 [Entamoeba nuttalli P19]|eukprot:XP_008856345.1 hypothetical protein ENU1_060010 [Entamoeba nuttalli P19]